MKLYLRDSSVTRVGPRPRCSRRPGPVGVKATNTTREQVECEHLPVSRVVCAVMSLLDVLYSALTAIFRLRALESLPLAQC